MHLLGVIGIALFVQTAGAASNTTIEVELRDLRPTQFSVGRLEVEERAENMKTWSSKKLKEELYTHEMPLIRGPGGELYLTDRHHFAQALLEIGETHAIGRVMHDWSDLSIDDFWKRMKKEEKCFLFDSEGSGPFDPDLLPKRLSQLQNDPYRSLAWLVRIQGGYKKTRVLYAEFQWAQYFRSRIAITKRKRNIENAVPEAIRLAGLPDAKDLPGYDPKACKALIGSE